MPSIILPYSIFSLDRNAMSHLHQDKKILNRVKRIQGQIDVVLGF